MKMAALTSNFKDLSASTKFRLVFINKGSLFRTRRGFERDHCVQLSACVACLMFDLFILCLVQEHWPFLYLRSARSATGSITLAKGIWVFCLYAFVFPNICKSMNHTVGHCYWCTNIVSQNWNKLNFQLLHFFFVPPYPHSRHFCCFYPLTLSGLKQVKS